MDFVESIHEKEMTNLDEFMKRNKRRSFTVLLIGAGPVQPLAMNFAQKIFKNDKYRCTLVNINPRSEFISQYEWEQEQYQLIQNDFNMKL